MCCGKSDDIFVEMKIVDWFLQSQKTTKEGILQLNNVNYAIVENNMKQISQRELTPIVGNDHNCGRAMK